METIKDTFQKIKESYDSGICIILLNVATGKEWDLRSRITY